MKKELEDLEEMAKEAASMLQGMTDRLIDNIEYDLTEYELSINDEYIAYCTLNDSLKNFFNIINKAQ